MPGISGSCNGDELAEAAHKEVTLTSARWGIAAPMGEGHRFKFPLVLDTVNAGSEADEKGLKVGDMVVAIKVADGAWMHVTPAQQSLLFVTDDITNALKNGGHCTLKVQQTRRGRKCDSCGQHAVFDDKHARACEACGVVAEDSRMAIESEVRHFTDDFGAKENSGRTGALEAVGTAPTTTSLGKRKGRSAGGAEVARAMRRAKNEEPQRPEAEIKISQIIADLCTKLQAKCVQAAAERLCLTYEKARAGAAAAGRSTSKHGRSREVVAAAVLSVAARERRCPLDVPLILAALAPPAGAASGGKPVATLTAVHREAREIEKMVAGDRPALVPKEYLGRFCSFLGLDFPAQRAAEEALEELPAALASMMPATVAAAAIVRTSQQSERPRHERVSAQQASEAAGVTATAIRAAVKKWAAAEPHLDRSLPAPAHAAGAEGCGIGAEMAGAEGEAAVCVEISSRACAGPEAEAGACGAGGAVCVTVLHGRAEERDDEMGGAEELGAVAGGWEVEEAPEMEEGRGVWVWTPKAAASSEWWERAPLLRQPSELDQGSGGVD